MTGKKTNVKMCFCACASLPPPDRFQPTRRMDKMRVVIPPHSLSFVRTMPTCPIQVKASDPGKGCSLTLRCSSSHTCPLEGLAEAVT